MYSKELRELDSNTVQYMIDQMQEDLNRNDAQLSQQENLIAELQNQIQKMKKLLAEKPEKI